ncbi:unnamed protein product [Lota lota]
MWWFGAGDVRLRPDTLLDPQTLVRPSSPSNPSNTKPVANMPLNGAAEQDKRLYSSGVDTVAYSVLEDGGTVASLSHPAGQRVLPVYRPPACRSSEGTVWSGAGEVDARRRCLTTKLFRASPACPNTSPRSHLSARRGRPARYSRGGKQRPGGSQMTDRARQSPRQQTSASVAQAAPPLVELCLRNEKTRRWMAVPHDAPASVR